MIFSVPYPPKILSPNSRTHWAVKHRVFQKYKGDCFVLAKACRPVLGDKDIHLLLKFHPQKARRRDIDNAVASAKAILDGISAAWGIDDSKFHILPSFGELKNPPCVIIEVMQ